MKLFEYAQLGPCLLNNRIIRSATFEGMADDQGRPLPAYRKLYQELASGGVGGIITGFVYVSPEGKAMQPGQAGLDSAEKINCYSPVTKEVHRYGSKIFLQLAHTGRQTRKEDTGFDVVGASNKKSPYFGGSPRELSTKEVYQIARRFADSAFYAQEAGFDGVQVHAAHGYLIHQFILPSINHRKDEFAIDGESGLGTKFFEVVLAEIRKRCAGDFALLVKISGGDDYFNGLTKEQFTRLIRFLDRVKVDGIEISYGTMDNALNIFRGDIPYKVIFKYNPIFKLSNWRQRPFHNMRTYLWMRRKIKPFTHAYNLEYAKIAKELTDTPIIPTGGFRRGEDMRSSLESGAADFISICRPFLCEPDLVEQLKLDENYIAKCTNCNTCAVMCDSSRPTRCYRRVKR